MNNDDLKRESMKVVLKKFHEFIWAARFHGAGHDSHVLDPEDRRYPLPVGMSCSLDFMAYVNPIDVYDFAAKKDFEINRSKGPLRKDF